MNSFRLFCSFFMFLSFVIFYFFFLFSFFPVYVFSSFSRLSFFLSFFLSFLLLNFIPAIKFQFSFLSIFFSCDSLRSTSLQSVHQRRCLFTGGGFEVFSSPNRPVNRSECPHSSLLSRLIIQCLASTSG